MLVFDLRHLLYPPSFSAKFFVSHRHVKGTKCQQEYTLKPVSTTHLYFWADITATHTRSSQNEKTRPCLPRPKLWFKSLPNGTRQLMAWHTMFQPCWNDGDIQDGNENSDLVPGWTHSAHTETPLKVTANFAQAKAQRRGCEAFESRSWLDLGVQPALQLHKHCCFQPPAGKKQFRLKNLTSRGTRG